MSGAGSSCRSARSSFRIESRATSHTRCLTANFFLLPVLLLVLPRAKLSDQLNVRALLQGGSEGREFFPRPRPDANRCGTRTGPGRLLRACGVAGVAGELGGE
jgi:hypothetical protein